jgi:ATP-dependent Clp protease ATP-binding subunit ClpC
MTSNIGSRQLKDFGTGVGFGTMNKEASREKDAKQVIETQLRKFFSPEFLNRIDDVIVFNSLAKEEIIQILDIRMKKVLKRIADIGYHVELTDTAKSFLAEKGFDPDFGARPLQRALQKYMEEPLAEQVLQGNLKEGSYLKVDHAEGADELLITVASKQLDATESEIIAIAEASETKTLGSGETETAKPKRGRSSKKDNDEK